MEQEVKDYIDKKIEGIYLSLTDIVGNAMTDHAFLHKTNMEFYKAHPEFKDKKEAVASIVELVDSENPGIPYDKLLEKALPRIQERVNMVKGVDVETVSAAPTRDFSSIEAIR